MSLSIAMVALGPQAKVSGSAIGKAWAARWPNGPLPGPLEKSGSTLSFRVGDVDVIYGIMPAPIPWSALEQPCRHAPFWPEAEAKMRAHARHVIVTATGGGDDTAAKVALMHKLTQATAAFVEAAEGVVGVYWCNSENIVEPRQFVDIAAKFVPRGKPLPLWVTFQVGHRPGGGSLGLTQGLAAFGLMEFETSNSPEPPKELRSRLVGLVDYLLDNGPVIRDGDTIGDSAAERIKITYGPSVHGLAGNVMRMDYEAPPEPRGKMTLYGVLHLLGSIAVMIAFGYALYNFLPFLREGWLRHFIFVPVTIVFGFLFMLITDNFLQKTFNLHVFAPTDKSA